MNTLIKNIFISFMLLTVIVGYDVAHTPEVSAKAFVESPTISPEPVGTTHITKMVIYTSTPTPSAPPTQDITVKVSHYWPALGGVNCLTFKDGKCISKMANGKPWDQYVDVAIACPRELKLGTKIKILGKIWICMDRGSKITKVGDAYWVDMLTEKTPIAYGTEVSAKIIK